jgi:sigma-B regulation protein RsbU (phosphoserine phosphatase)
MQSAAELQASLRVDLAYLAVGILVLSIAIALLIIAIAGRIRAPVVTVFGIFNLLYGTRLLFGIDTFQFIIGVSQLAASEFFAALNYVIPVAGIYLGTFFVSPRSRQILLRLTAAYGVMALIGIPSDLLTGRPMSLHTPYTVLVIAGMLLMSARIAADIRNGFLHLDWSIRWAGAGFGLFVASVLYDNFADVGLLRALFIEPFGFLAFLCGMGLAIEHRVIADYGRLMLLRAEMEQARRIQQSILPATPPAGTPFRIAATYSPMTAVAGDLYDFIRFGEGRLGLFVADVSGHGVPAALVASMLKTALTIYGLTCGSPAGLLKELNRVFCGRFEGEFITAACAVLDAGSQRLTYSAAGHPPLLLWRANASEIRHVEQNGLPLGIRASADYKDFTLPFARGDRLAMYTDGIVETENTAGEEFGHERLGKILALSEFDVNACLRQALGSVLAWRGHENEQNDDFTLVIAEYAAAHREAARSGQS